MISEDGFGSYYASKLVAGCGNVIGAGNLNKDNNSTHTMRTAMAFTIREHSNNSEPIIADSSRKYYEASYYESLRKRYILSRKTTQK